MKRWFWNTLIALDQFGNAIANGNPDETISSRLGRLKLAAFFQDASWPWYCRWLDAFLDWADPRGGSHALNAIEDQTVIQQALAQGLELVFDHDGRIVGFAGEARA